VLIKPYTIDELLGAVREVLRVTAGDHELGQPSTRKDKPTVNDWRNLLIRLRADKT